MDKNPPKITSGHYSLTNHLTRLLTQLWCDRRGQLGHTQNLRWHNFAISSNLFTDGWEENESKSDFLGLVSHTDWKGWLDGVAIKKLPIVLCMYLHIYIAQHLQSTKYSTSTGRLWLCIPFPFTYVNKSKVHFITCLFAGLDWLLFAFLKQQQTSTF